MSQQQRKYPYTIYEIVHAQQCPQCGMTQQSLAVKRSYDRSVRVKCKHCGSQWTRTWKNIAESLENLTESDRTRIQGLKADYEQQALTIRQFTNTTKLTKKFKTIPKFRKMLNTLVE